MRGQAAMEFLMTYGWAFAVMIALVAGLVIFNPLSDINEVEYCDTTNRFGCNPANAFYNVENDTLGVRLQIGTDDSLRVQNVSLVSVNSENVSSNCSSGALFQESQPLEVACYNISGGDFLQGEVVEGELVQGEMSLEYYPASQTGRYATPVSIRFQLEAGTRSYYTPEAS